MPEVISKYPEITIQVLEGAGAVCAKGAPQMILKACPQESFCSFPGGEICVFGLDEIEQKNIELMLIEPGKNYGWSTTQGNQTMEGIESPILHYQPPFQGEKDEIHF